MAVWRSMRAVLSRRGRTSRTTILLRRIGRWPDFRISLKRACREFLPSATSAPAILSVLHRQLVRDRSRSPSCIRYCRNKKDTSYHDGVFRLKSECLRVGISQKAQRGIGRDRACLDRQKSLVFGGHCVREQSLREALLGAL